MIIQQVRKAGNSFVVTIPKSEVERLNLREGTMVALELSEVEVRPVLRPELQEIADRTRESTTPVMRYLRDQ